MFTNNNCKFIGRLTKSPMESLKRLENGNSFLSISIAVKSDALDKDGQPYQRTDYPQLTLWNDKAVAAAKDFGKGALVEVTAIVQTRRFKAEDGTSWRYTTDFLVQSMDDLPSKPAPEARPLEIVVEAEPVALVSGESHQSAQTSAMSQPKPSAQKTKSRSRSAKK